MVPGESSEQYAIAACIERRASRLVATTYARRGTVFRAAATSKSAAALSPTAERRGERGRGSE